MKKIILTAAIYRFRRSRTSEKAIRGMQGWEKDKLCCQSWETTYTITVTNEVTDTSGCAMEANYQFSYRTNIATNLFIIEPDGTGDTLTAGDSYLYLDRSGSYCHRIIQLWHWQWRFKWYRNYRCMICGSWGHGPHVHLGYYRYAHWRLLCLWHYKFKQQRYYSFMDRWRYWCPCIKCCTLVRECSASKWRWCDF